MDTSKRDKINDLLKKASGRSAQTSGPTPTATAAQPASVGPPPGVPTHLVRLTSKFDTYCRACMRNIKAGDRIGWNPAKKGDTYCETCSPHAVPPTASGRIPTPQPSPVQNPRQPLHSQPFVITHPKASLWLDGSDGPLPWWEQDEYEQWAVTTKRVRVSGVETVAYQLLNQKWYTAAGQEVQIKPATPPPKPSEPSISISTHVATTADMKALVALEAAVVERASKHITDELRAGFDKYNKMKARAIHPSTPEAEARTALKFAILELVKLVY